MLGPSPPSKRAHDVPVEMAVFREKLRPGSGVLAVKVITDGPTRVLQVTDINQQVIPLPLTHVLQIIADNNSKIVLLQPFYHLCAVFICSG